MASLQLYRESDEELLDSLGLGPLGALGAEGVLTSVSDLPESPRRAGLGQLAQIFTDQAASGWLGQASGAISAVSPYSLLNPDAAPPEGRWVVEEAIRNSPEAVLARERDRRAQAAYDASIGGVDATDRFARGLAYYGGNIAPLATELIATRGRGLLGNMWRGALMGAGSNALMGVTEPEAGRWEADRAIVPALAGGLMGGLFPLAGAAGIGGRALPGLGAAAAAGMMGEEDPARLLAAGIAGQVAAEAPAAPGRAVRAIGERGASRAEGRAFDAARAEPGRIAERIRSAEAENLGHIRAALDPRIEAPPVSRVAARLWESALNEAGQVGGGPRVPFAPPKIPPVRNPVGLKGRPPEPDFVPRSKSGNIIASRLPEIRTFEKPPENEPPGYVGVSAHAGRNLGKSLQVAANPGHPEFSVVNDARWKRHGMVYVPFKDGRGAWFGAPRNHDERLKRIEQNIPDLNERVRAGRWYHDIASAISSVAPALDPRNVVAAFGVGNQNDSPLGALQKVIGRIEAASGSEIPYAKGVAGDAMDAALRGEGESVGFGEQTFKISDFTDGIARKTVRSAMNNDPRGGSPVAIDVHAARAMGMFDRKIYDELYKAATPEGRKVLRRLKVDAGEGSVKPGQYERMAAEYRSFAEYLNKKAYLGRTDWTGADAQALDWVSQVKSMPKQRGGQGPRELVQHFTRTASVEFSFPREVARAIPSMGRVLDQYESLRLSPEIERDVTTKILQDTASQVERMVGMQPGGIELVDVSPSYWGGDGQLAGQFMLRGSPGQIAAAVDAIAVLRRQYAIPVFRPKDGGDKVGFFLKGDALADPKQRKTVYLSLKREFEKRGLSLPDGYTPTKLEGSPSIVSLYIGRGMRIKKSRNRDTGAWRYDWVDGDPLPWEADDIVRGKTRSERAADEIRAKMTDPTWQAKIESSIEAVEKALGIELEGGYGGFEGGFHDNPDPATGTKALSRLGEAGRGRARGLVQRALREADGRARHAVAAGLSRRRIEAYGYPGFDASQAYENSRLQPALMLVQRDPDKPGALIRTPLPRRSGYRSHADLFQDAQRKGYTEEDSTYYIESELASMKSWLERVFFDRATGEVVDRYRAKEIALAEFGEDVLAKYNHFNEGAPPEGHPGRGVWNATLREFLLEGLNSEVLAGLIREARKHFMREAHRSGVRAR